MTFQIVQNTTTNANTLPAQMVDIVWSLNTDTGYYDILNEYTPLNNSGNLQVIQSKILITLGTFQGEWQPQPIFGIPLSSLYTNSDNPDVLAQIVVNEILTVQNVNNVTINDLNYIATTRQFMGNFSVNTVYGVTSINLG
jgi:hypothetical protein